MKINIKLKIAILLCLAVAVFFGASILIVYSQWSNSLVAAAGQNNKETAHLIASWISDIIDREASRLGGANGQAAINDLAQDKSTGSWSLSFNGNLSDVSAVFKALEGFEIGRTGKAVLIDDKCYLIYHPGLKPFTNRFCSYDNLQKLLNSNSGYVFIDSAYLGKGNTLVAYDKVNNPLLLKKGLNWLVIVSQESEEVYEPLKTLLARTSVTGIIFIIIAIFAGFLLGKLFLRPIDKLKDGMRRLGAGDLDCKVASSGSDEIGELAKAFNEMAADLKNTTIPKTYLRKESEATKQAEDKAQRLGSEFTSVISQIKADLSAVKAGTGADKLTGEVNNALEFVMAESGHLGLKIAPGDIKLLLKKIVFRYEPKIREKGLDLKVDMPKGALNVQFDADRITQVFNALIESAIKFTEKGRIEILVKELPDEAECDVVYTGPFLSHEDFGKDFARNSELAIAKSIVELHGGRLWSERESPVISKIKFILPKIKKS